MSKILKFDETIIYDTIVIGAGPAAVSASIYAARKGLKTAMIGEDIGGQILDTNEIENIIGIPLTNGFDYAMELEKHMSEYEIYFYKGHRVKEIIDEGSLKKIITDDSKIVSTKTIIIATGAKWRQLGIPGEKEYTGKGVHYCSTCDGPFYRNKDVVIVGGGNSGVEAAIEISNIAKNVVLVEYMDELKADKVLQDRLSTLDNVRVYLSSAVTEILGNEYAEIAKLRNRNNSDEFELKMDGLFVEIGLTANTDIAKDLVNLNNFGEIIVDEMNMTSINGIFAAGDCTNTKHKQIIIAMGEGAKAALSAFEYIIKN
ncbi:FAD-dependent oxidoreductase [Streptobacillus felis]|uniref:FAD-dependent oxidoreductase n=1 Tax=Streptobacillus felis TaxID=1384509 RepID=A0A7Z0PDN5_9FUSO|nr:FAD-dependent oxidoreductase [Streptobacillus felis]NYV27339.1 FAD-dependent oxidoreductase [Streptobacillus felis]